ncbi:hypothetical protein C8A01DRAFT_19242 [Parachaetomium inaequale]|uniref:Uncharacterized protein n=1 Tax=Parachaetomium inaequale TaxID=2588326 RepID=A0AAN6PBR2_9PEZI|nr:hypothetical protein C8A01DRAFT_19242 [Parachaetomium inaequale]
MAMPISRQRAGHIVALEGPADLVSTQLRLLPASHQILILPSLQHYLGNTSRAAPFDPRELIHRYHAASQTRHAEALEFLRPATSTGEKRLVLLHGGTMSAQVSCLSTIMEHEPDGDIEEAHATFIRLASNGLARLSSARFSRHDEWAGYTDARADTVEDRIIRAMRAAEALDKETEFLQPLTPDVDLTVKLVDIPPSKKRLSPAVVEAAANFRGSRPPSPCDSQTRLSAEPVPGVSPDTTSPDEPASAAPRKPLLRIHIPSSPIPWAGDVRLGGNQHSPSPVYRPKDPVPGAPRHRRSQTAESILSPGQEPTSDGNAREGAAVPESESHPLPRNGDGIPAERNAVDAAETAEQPFESVLPLLEDLVVFFTPETPDQLHNFLFRRLSEGYKTPRQSVCGPLIPHHDASHAASQPAMGAGQEVDHVSSADDVSVTPWMPQDLVHGLPTPNHSPNPLDGSSVAMPPLDTRFYSISVGQETAVSIQNFLRSFLGSQFPLQDRRFSAADGGEFPAEAGLWRALECDGQTALPNGESRLDLILAVGAESGVTKNRLSEVVGQVEKLGFKASGLSRSGRLDIRFLIANAMQAFTAQPLTKQIQSNPFADRALLAALIIPHLETYLATHPDVRFLLIEYPSEHLPTILALQTLIGTAMMKVVGIIDSDVSTPVQSLSVAEANRRPSEGFRSLNRRGSRTSGAFVGPCSFSKANFLLASSATGFETAAFIAAIRESLISISDYYMPERPLYKHPPPQTPPKKAYPSLTVNTKSPDTKSPSQKKETSSRVSVSTLIITPPSSPIESSSPPTHPRSVPPRTPSSSTTPSPPRRAARSARDTASMKSRVKWGEVNYAPATDPSIPTTTTTDTDTAMGGGPIPCSGSTPGSNHSRSSQKRHRKMDSDPLSPRGTAAPSSAVLSSRQSGHAAHGHAAHAHGNGDEQGGGQRGEDDSDDSDDVPDEEERRLLPLYLQRREEIERGRSSKAMRWLGLS